VSPDGSTPRNLAWLTARPIAHRGLHDAARGIVENMPAAAAAAIAGNYGIEADLQISAEGEAMVHHDGALGRLADGDGALRDLPAARLKQVPFKATAERMMTLGDDAAGNVRRDPPQFADQRRVERADPDRPAVRSEHLGRAGGNAEVAVETAFEF